MAQNSQGRSKSAASDRKDAPAERADAASRGAARNVELVKLASGGDVEAFEDLVRRHANTIVRFARHMVGDYEAAEDVAQEAFLKAYSHIARLDDPAKFATWLYSITRHCCLDWLRTRRPAVSVEGLEEDGVEVADSRSPSPGETIEEHELHGKVLDEVHKLRADYREILLMKHVYELSYKEISDMVGLSVSAVGEKLCRVRQMLRRRLKSSGQE